MENIFDRSICEALFLSQYTKESVEGIMGAQESCVFNAVKQFDMMLLEMKGLAASCMSTLVVFFEMDCKPFRQESCRDLPPFVI